MGQKNTVLELAGNVLNLEKDTIHYTKTLDCFYKRYESTLNTRLAQEVQRRKYGIVRKI